MPTLQDGLAALNISKDQQLAISGVFEPTQDFAKRASLATPENIEMSSIEEVKELLLQKYRSREAGQLTRDYILNRSSQIERLANLGPQVLLELISAGMTTARLSKELQISHATLYHYLQINSTAEEISQAEALGADMLIDEGREHLENADAASKTAVQKATEIARNNHLVAKALSDKYHEKRAGSQTNIQVNTLGAGEAGEQTGWLRVWEPEQHELKPLKPVKSITKPEQPDLNEDMLDGKFKIG